MAGKGDRRGAGQGENGVDWYRGDKMERAKTQASRNHRVPILPPVLPKACPTLPCLSSPYPRAREQGGGEKGKTPNLPAPTEGLNPAP